MRRNRASVMTKSTFLKSKLKVLSDFGITVTDEISDEIASRYPNEKAVEQYTRKIILDYLGDD